MSTPSVKIIADSVSPDGVRLTSIECTFHRFILAEVNTHRDFSRNSASSRAIPVERTLERLLSSPWYPIVWSREQPGMSGGADLEGQDLEDAVEVMVDISMFTLERIKSYVDSHPDKATRLHKSLLNRPMEWFSSHTALITSTRWDNFFRQRLEPDAQPEFRVLAERIHEALDESLPEQLEEGQWHLPYIGLNPDDESLSPLEALKVSAGRCARTSYLTHDGLRSVDADIRLYDETLAKHGHWSPLEHVAVVWPSGDVLTGPRRPLGNFDAPWSQMRHLVELAQEDTLMYLAGKAQEES